MKIDIGKASFPIRDVSVFGIRSSPPGPKFHPMKLYRFIYVRGRLKRVELDQSQFFRDPGDLHVSIDVRGKSNRREFRRVMNPKRREPVWGVIWYRDRGIVTEAQALICLQRYGKARCRLSLKLSGEPDQYKDRT